VKRTIRILKDELYRVARTRAEAKRLGPASAKDIDPVRDVSLARIVVPNEDARFVLRRIRRVRHMHFQKLVLQRPFNLYMVFNGSIPDLAG